MSNSDIPFYIWIVGWLIWSLIAFVLAVMQARGDRPGNRDSYFEGFLFSGLLGLCWPLALLLSVIVGIPYFLFYLLTKENK